MSSHELQKFSTDELARELKARQEESKARLRLARIEKNRKIIPALLSVVEHDRTSCSDDKVINYSPNSESFARCARCAMLYAVENDEYDNIDVFLNATVTFSK